MNHHNYSIDSFSQNGLHFSRIHLNFISPCKQPLHSDDKRYSLLFFGEIFSVDGDPSSVIEDSPSFFLELIQKQGLEILKKINGQFSCCLYDHVEESTWLITDRFGTHPLYYAVNNNRLLFASEVKAILKDNIRKKIDYHGIAELFSFGHLFGTKTLFENIHQVPPASIIKYKQNTLTTSQYWDYPYSEHAYLKHPFDKKKTNELQEMLGQIMITAARRQASDIDKTLIPLSGGLDSRWVAGLYHQLGGQGMSTYTMGPKESEDQEYAAQAARMLNFQHFPFAINPERTWKDANRFSFLSDGMSYLPGSLQNFEPLEYFATSKKILTASQMCDVLFGSTLTRRPMRILQENKEPRSVTNEILINLFKLYDQNQIKLLFRDDVFKKIDGTYRSEPVKYCDDHFHPLHNYFRLIEKEHGRRGTMGGNLVTNLFYSTRMISYDNDVFDFGWKLPIEFREYQYLYRKSFCQLFPDLAKIKRQGYGLDITASNASYELTLLKNKVGILALKSPLKHIARYYKPWNRPSYVNYQTWFKNQMKENLVSFFSDGNLKSKELINVGFVQTLLNEHMSGQRDNASLLWQVINLEYFYRNFID